jgi:hypothetical protein
VALASVQASGLENLNGELFGMKVIEVGGLHRNNFDLCRVSISDCTYRAVISRGQASHLLSVAPAVHSAEQVVSSLSLVTS